jgi:hypothetical protein
MSKSAAVGDGKCGIGDVVGEVYPTAIDTAHRLGIAGHGARIVTPPLFIATKLEAFHGRGGDDVFTSHDLEDIITVVDGRPEIVDDVGAAAREVSAHISTEVGSLLRNPDFIEALAGSSCPMQPARLVDPFLSNVWSR